MKKNIKKILDTFNADEVKGIDKEDTIAKLERMGYSGKEINKLIESVSQRTKSFSVTKRFKRVLSESEKLSLSTAAQGYLIQMVDYGLISEYELDILLETISIEKDYPASLKDVKLFIERFIADLPNGFTNTDNRNDVRFN